MAKEPQIHSLGRISDRTESLESEVDIQAVQLVQGTILACEASRGASGMLSSQQESPEISPMHFQANAATLEYPSTRTPDWLIDSGSTNHMYHDKDDSTRMDH